MSMQRLLRRLAIRNLHSPVPTAEIHKTNNILHLTQSQIVEHQIAHVHQYSKVNLTKKAQVNKFLQSLLRNDFNGAINTLRSIGSKCNNPSTYPEYGVIYVSCLYSLLTYILKDSKDNLLQREINEIASAAVTFSTQFASQFADDVTEIQGLTLMLYLNALRGVEEGQKMKMLNIVTQLKILMKKFKVSSLDLLNSIIKHDVNVIDEFRLIFKLANLENAKDVQLKDAGDSQLALPIDKYRNSDGSLSFAGLCDFITKESFSAQNKTSAPGSKLHEIYDRLSEEKKGPFLQEYHAFNKQKQLIIESCSQNLYKFASSKQQVAQFTKSHDKWMSDWSKELSLAIEQLMVSDQHMQKHGFIVTYLSADKIASMCLSYLMSSTIPAVHAKVMPLVNRITHAISFELKKLSSFSSNHRMKHIFTEEDMNIFVGDMIKLTVDVCKLPSEIQMAVVDNEEGGSDSAALFTHELAKDSPDNSKFKLHGVVRIHPFIAESFKCYQDLLQTGFYHLPMIHPPRNWTSPKEGGFLSLTVPFVISSEPKSSEYIMTLANRTGQLDSVYKSLNALGSTPWAVNPFMYRAFSKTLKEEKLKNLLIPAYAKSAQQLEEAQKELNAMSSDTSVSRSEVNKCRKLIRSIERDRLNLTQYYSLIDTFALSLSTNGELFYLPHHLDFRGRVYPSVSFLSPHSEDSVRSLLMFWESKELGPNGFDWLKYQLSSMYNKAKLDMQELLLFVDNNRHNILESAKDPFGGSMWWARGDNPWQSLALCHEIASIWQYDGDVSKYKSRISVHQDGTCNGLQHYSALSGEVKAAESVNVLPSKRRHDVYSTVLSLVKESISQVYMAGQQDSELAKLVLPVLNRKLIKQTVMTTVYGVTLYGATKQIKNQIEDFLVSNPAFENRHDLKENSSRSASFIARHVLLSINELFKGAQLIQHWLVENCTRSIQSFNSEDCSKSNVDFFSTKHYQPFMWTSLSGFPIVQYYRKIPKGYITSTLQNLKVRKLNKLAPIDEQKLINAVAPNFIHSIDAIHLLMTSLASQERKLTFAAIHDCFWTHASDVSDLSPLVREEFIRLHNSNVLENLRNDLIYVNRNNYQLVWVNNNANKDFCEELKTLRESYPIVKEGKSRPLVQNDILKHELINGSAVQRLIEKHKPQLLYKARSSRGPIIYDGIRNVELAEKISKKSHVPLLVPLKVLDLPSLGALKLESVKDSVFFFS